MLDQPSCQNVSDCTAGYEEIRMPTVASDRVCSSCLQDVTFKELPGQMTVCIAVQNCTQGQYETSLPTISTDRVCTACPPGTFKDTEGQSMCIAVANVRIHRDDDRHGYSYPYSAPLDSTRRRLQH